MRHDSTRAPVYLFALSFYISLHRFTESQMSLKQVASLDELLTGGTLEWLQLTVHLVTMTFQLIAHQHLVALVANNKLRLAWFLRFLRWSHLLDRFDGDGHLKTALLPCTWTQ